MGFKQPWIIYTVLGMAALHLSQEDAGLEAVANNYYYTAVKAVREAINSGKVQGTEDWLLTSTIFFYLFLK